jgi:hypothetical protein
MDGGLKSAMGVSIMPGGVLRTSFLPLAACWWTRIEQLSTIWMSPS